MLCWIYAVGVCFLSKFVAIKWHFSFFFFFSKNITVSTRQWHLAGQEFRTQKTTWTSLNSSYRQCDRVLTFKPSVQKIQLPTQTSYVRENQHTVKSQKIKKGKCVSETCLKYYSSPQNISYLPRDMGKMAMFDKNTTSNAVYKASKI